MRIPKLVMAACLVSVLVMGCGHKPAVRYDGRSRYPAGPGVEAGDSEQRLRAEASRWQGTPHRMGGSDLKGVDCSGLVKKIYLDAFGIRMPRTARRQAVLGVRVSRNDLKPGDLVFFRPPGKKEHVGIYLGKGEFVHASATRGVTISRMELNYWRRYYWTARRVLR
jgi:cell wall-associated NlpC family hydrolase